MTNKADEDDWWKALAGKADAHTSRDTVKITTLLRNSINRYEKELIRSNYDVEKELSKLEKTLENQGLAEAHSRPNRPLRNKWTQFGAVFATAFAFGAIIMRFAMVPSMELARSGSEIISIDGITAQKIVLHVDTPNDFIGQITRELLTIDIKFAISKEENRYILVMYGLVPLSPEQERLKKILGINPSASGSVLFEIHGK